MAVNAGRLNQKVALVTGAGSGMGREIALMFAREGANVFLVGRRRNALEETMMLLKKEGLEGVILSKDISDENDVEEIIQVMIEKAGRIDILVHCAGVVKRNEDLTETPVDEWNHQMNVNLTGTYLLAKHVIPHLKQNGGAIVNIASQLALVGAPGYATYCATKGGVLSLSRALAVDLAPYGVRVNCISPGLVDTEMAYVEREDFDPATAGKGIPLGRVGSPKDIAYAALYLATDEAAWVTGANLVVDGGYTAK